MFKRMNSGDSQSGANFRCNPQRTWGAPTPDLPWSHMPTGFWDIATGRLRKWVLSQDVDAWILTSVYTSPSTQYLARLLTRMGMCWAYLGEPPRPRSGVRGIIRNRLARSVLRRAQGVIGTGTKAAEMYRALSGPEKKRASVPYYINVDCFLQLPLPKTPAPGANVRFATSAQLIQRKGIDVLLRACALLPDEGWELDIYGEGPLREALEREARATGKPIRFVGSVDYDRRVDVFRGRHCFVFSTRWDGWGMVVPEAMAAGLPLISTDQAVSSHDFVRDGVNGYIGPAEDSRFLAQAMRRFIVEPQRIPTFAAAARSAMADYRPEVGAERLVRFMRELRSSQTALS